MKYSSGTPEQQQMTDQGVDILDKLDTLFGRANILDHDQFTAKYDLLFSSAKFAGAGPLGGNMIGVREKATGKLFTGFFVTVPCGEHHDHSAYFDFQPIPDESQPLLTAGHAILDRLTGSAKVFNGPVPVQR